MKDKQLNNYKLLSLLKFLMLLCQQSWITTREKVPEDIVDNAHAFFNHCGIILAVFQMQKTINVYFIFYAYNVCI